MKRTIGTLLLSSVFASLALAGPFTNVYGSGTGVAYAEASSNLNYNSNGGSDTQYGDNFYAGAGGSASVYNTWEDTYWYVSGQDEWGNDIWDYYTESKGASAEASAYAYARLASTDSIIEAEVYADGYTNSYAYGTDAWASASANANSNLWVNFSLSSNSYVTLSSSTQYGYASVELSGPNGYIINSDWINGNTQTFFLGAGDYTLNGYAGMGGADLYLSAQSAVPEPASMAVLGLGAVALLRRRVKK